MKQRTLATWGIVALLFAVQSSSAIADDVGLEDWQLGRAALAQGRFEDAASAFRHYRERHPDKAYGWVMEGRALWQADEREEAVSRFQSAIGVDPTHPDALVHLAKHAYDARRYEDSLAYASSLEEIPDRLQSYHDFILGAALLRTNHDPELAADHLSRAEIEDYDGKVLLGLAWLRAGRRSEALAVLGELCPLTDEMTGRTSWSQCLGAETCETLLDERLEILRLLADSRP